MTRLSFRCTHGKKSTENKLINDGEQEHVVTTPLGIPEPPNVEIKARIFQLQNPNLHRFPEHERGLVQENSLGLAISGGGSRSLALTCGYLRGIRAVFGEEKIDYISTLSGGSWATSIYCFSKETDYVLLGGETEPSELTLDNLRNGHHGKITQTVSTEKFHALGKAVKKFLARVPERNLWCEVMEDTFLKDFALDNRLIALDETDVSEIKQRNPDLKDMEFTTLNPERPFPVISSTLFGPDDYNTGEGNSYQTTPLYSGVPFYSRLSSEFEEIKPLAKTFPRVFGRKKKVINLTIGGGCIESFAVNVGGAVQLEDQILEAGNEEGLREVRKFKELKQYFTLGDAIGASSAAFASVVSNTGILANISPMIRYTPFYANNAITSKTASSSLDLNLGDGGFMENLGLLPLLQRNVKRVVCMINTYVPLDLNFSTKDNLLEIKGKKGDERTIYRAACSDFLALFGVRTATNSSQNYTHNQVFHENQVRVVLSGLIENVKEGKGAVYKTKLQVLQNKFWNIKGNYEVDIVFIYNHRCENFLDSLPKETRESIDKGEDGNFAHFPHSRIPQHSQNESEDHVDLGIDIHTYKLTKSEKRIGVPKPPSTSVNATVFQLQDPKLHEFPEKVKGLVRENSIGIAISGGGSRSLALTCGYLRAIKALFGQEKIDYISTLSGGAWVTGAYCFSREADEVLLGAETKPSELTLKYLKGSDHGKITLTVTTSKFRAVGKAVKKFFQKVPRRNMWSEVIEDTFLKPFGLDNRLIALTNDHVRDIIERNPDLSGMNFATLTKNKPFPIISSTLYGPNAYNTGEGNCFQTTPLYSGVPFYSRLNSEFEKIKPLAKSFPGVFGKKKKVINLTIGGGCIETFAVNVEGATDIDDQVFQETSQTGVEEVREFNMLKQYFTLGDLVGSSSAAHASVVNNTGYFDEVSPWIRYTPFYSSQNVHKDHLPRSIDLNLGDGGFLENTGLLPLFQRRVKRIICILNTNIPLDINFAQKSSYVTVKRKKGKNILKYCSATTDLLSLFGVKVPIYDSENHTHDQVFHEDELKGVLSGLVQSIKSGRGAVFATKLEVLENKFWNIVGGYDADIVFVYNEKCLKFEEQLPRDTKHSLRMLEKGKFAHFPHYNTTFQNKGAFSLSKEQVGLLAAQGEFLIKENASTFETIFHQI
eukprot:augustus_masked-scaffold_6-processed-gene-18.57-mRNA-1 protein AED:1.00 eAED:1.00 QI:0/0/0/0/1/1/2/0/1163